MNNNTSESISAPWLWTAWLIALIAAVGLVTANLIFGNLNQDEGWYLYAAGLIFSGKIPYRDFAFTQGPVMPYVYAFFYPVIQWGGLLAGRIITVLLGIAGVAFAAILAGKLARPGLKLPTALVCFILIAINVYQSYFCAVVKTYSLTIPFLTLALLLLHYALVKTSRSAVMLSAALLVLAAATRASAAVTLPVIFFLLLWERRKLAFAAWLYLLLGGIIASALVLGPFLIICPSNFYYLAGCYHSLREEGDLAVSLMFKCGFVSRIIQAYFVCLVFWIAALTAKRLRKNDSAGERAHNSGISSFLRRCIWIGAITVSLVHLCAPFPYDDYQVFVYPLFAVVVSVMMLEALPERAGKWVIFAALCLSLSSTVSSPINQDWFIEGRDLIWWHAKDKPPLIKLRETACKIHLLCKPNDLLLTQDPYLAVEAGCALPHGLEMGQFSYFPDLTNEQAKKLNVLNREMFADLLRNCPAPMAALSGYAFAMQSPKITPVSAEDKMLFTGIISNRYELFETVANFGQAATALRLYRKK